MHVVIIPYVRARWSYPGRLHIDSDGGGPHSRSGEGGERDREGRGLVIPLLLRAWS